MKTRGLFLSTLFMGAVFAGCSNEEFVDNGSEKSLAKSDNYIAVNIVAPSDAVSRGADGGFVAGDPEENKVTDAWFVFFNDAGGYVGAVEGKLENWSDGNGSIEKISSAVIVLSNPQTWPTQMVALLNTGMKQADFNGMTLADMKAMQGDYSANFVMSNSVYKNGNSIVTTTPLTDANICSSEQAAKNNPVSIPVERVLAKVEASASNVQILDPDIEPQLNGDNVKFIPEITGMALVHTNPISYLLKNIDGVNPASWAGWNDAANWRSYWANSAVPANGYTSYSYNEIADNQTSLSEYCFENTSETPTKLLVTAQFKAENATAYETILKYNGTYYTLSGLKQYLKDQYFAETEITIDNMAFVSAGTENEWEVKLSLGEGQSESIQAIVGTINNKTISQWTDGKCYYYVNVEHFGSDAYSVGIVRNHWYNLTINSIKGLGTPVFNPDEEIDPDKPEEENYFVAAEVKILKWKMVSQSVDLK